MSKRDVHTDVGQPKDIGLILTNEDVGLIAPSSTIQAEINLAA